jgi:hypothetical protein
MRRFRSLITQTPVLIVSMLAVALSLGGAAYASTQAAGHGHGASHPHAPAITHFVPVGHSSARAGSNSAPSTVTFNSLSLANGWQSQNANDETGNPKVGILNGIVYLKGSLAQPTPGSAIFASLPTRYRPTDDLYIPISTEFGDGSSSSAGTLFIGTNGTMEAYSTNSAVFCASGNSAQCFTSLAGVSFPVNS